MKQDRRSSIYGSLNGMHFLQQNKLTDYQLIRVEGQPFVENKFNSIAGSIGNTDENFNNQIAVSPMTAWCLLFLGALLNSFVPCWLMGDVKAESLTRNSWRYLTVSALFIPFMMYEQRNAKTQSEKFWNTLTINNLKPFFISTVNYCLWLLCLIFACKFTSLNHACCLAGLRIIIISALKIKNKQKVHEFQYAGNFLCIVGVLLVLTDSITLPQSLDPNVNKYLRVAPWKRLLIGDTLAIIGSVCSVYLDRNHEVPEMPRFTRLFIYNIFLSFNLITAGYFFGGSEFTTNIKFGVFGLYTYENLVSVFYVSIMLGLNLMLANILVAQIFNSVIISTSAVFELVITTMLYHILGFEQIPSGMTCLGFAFLVPGQIFIIGGQGALQNTENKINFELYRPTEIRSTKSGPTNLLKRTSSLKNSSKNSPRSPTLYSSK